MINKNSNYILGVFGGVGPLASSKFLESIYKVQSKNANFEQECTKVFLYSDPSMPDRTTYFNQGLKQNLLAQLSQGLYKLVEMGVAEIVICCYTLHYLLSDLPQNLINRIISLPCIALTEVLRQKKKALLLCTSGTMDLKIFENSPLWQAANEYIIKPDTDDQKLIHETIYMLKKNEGYEEANLFVQSMLKKYETDIWIVGCTEFHLLSAELTFSRNQPVDLGVIIDPLLLIAHRVCK